MLRHATNWNDDHFYGCSLFWEFLNGYVVVDNFCFSRLQLLPFEANFGCGPELQLTRSTARILPSLDFDSPLPFYQPSQLSSSLYCMFIVSCGWNGALGHCARNKNFTYIIDDSFFGMIMCVLAFLFNDHNIFVGYLYNRCREKIYSAEKLFCAPQFVAQQ